MALKPSFGPVVATLVLPYLAPSTIVQQIRAERATVRNAGPPCKVFNPDRPLRRIVSERGDSE